jgi:hypothetical protein
MTDVLSASSTNDSKERMRHASRSVTTYVI